MTTPDTILTSNRIAVECFPLRFHERLRMVRSRGINLSSDDGDKDQSQTLRGPWAAGFALDVHTTGSTFLGHNAYGHPVFDTGRSPIGELVYRLKYRGDKDAQREIVDTVAGFLLGRGSCRPTS